jgi:hypothetical protein
MIVYRDSQYRIGLREALARMDEYVRSAENGIDSARDLLIAAGQLEQGIADAATKRLHRISGRMYSLCSDWRGANEHLCGFQGGVWFLAESALRSVIRAQSGEARLGSGLPW